MTLLMTAAEAERLGAIFAGLARQRYRIEQLAGGDRLDVFNDQALVELLAESAALELTMQDRAAEIARQQAARETSEVTPQGRRVL